jgi:hypothetical protein
MNVGSFVSVRKEDKKELKHFYILVAAFRFKNVFLYTILLLGFISTQCLIDMTPITV